MNTQPKNSGWREKLAIAFIHIIAGLLAFLMSPFGFWIDKEPPHTTRGAINKLALLRDHRKEIMENLARGVSEANEMHNETVTQMRTLQVNIYLAGGAFLGVLVGILATSKIEVPGFFYPSAWLLLITLIIGPIVTFIEWNYEASRSNQMRQRQELAWMLLMQGGRDDEAIPLISETIDDIQKAPIGTQIFWVVLIIVKWLATLFFFLSICLVVGSFLLQKTKSDTDTYGVCISCPKL